MILKGKLKLSQLAGLDSAEIVVSFTNNEIDELWKESEPWQRACSNFLERLTTNTPNAREFNL